MWKQKFDPKLFMTQIQTVKPRVVDVISQVGTEFLLAFRLC